MKRIILALIRFYQRAVSPGLPAACRYEPTCSLYAYEAVQRYGALRGSWMAVRRLSRCVPWRPGGFDPVPLSASDIEQEEQEREEEKDSMLDDSAVHLDPAVRREVLR